MTTFTNKGLGQAVRSGRSLAAKASAAGGVKSGLSVGLGVLLTVGGVIAVSVVPGALGEGINTVLRADDRAVAVSGQPQKSSSRAAAVQRKPSGQRPVSQKPASQKTQAARGANAASSPMIEITPAREAAALTFAKEHHPELAALLSALKEIDSAEYREALRELFRSSERLAKMKERGDQRYELALAEWVVQSRLQLLAARYTMSRDEKLLSEMRELLVERQRIRLRLVELERDRAAARLAKLNADIERRSAALDTTVEDELRRIVRRADTAAPRKPQPTRQLPAEKSNRSSAKVGKGKAAGDARRGSSAASRKLSGVPESDKP